MGWRRWQSDRNGDAAQAVWAGPLLRPGLRNAANWQGQITAGLPATREQSAQRGITLLLAGYGVRIGTAYGPSLMKATLGTEPLRRGWFTAQMSAFWTMAAVLSASSI